MKTPSKLRIEGNFFNLQRASTKKYTSIILNDERLNTFPLKSEIRQGMSALTISVEHHCRGSFQCSQKEKQIKSIHVGKKEVKLYLVTNDIIIYVENLMKSIVKATICK